MKYLIYNCFFIVIILFFAYINTKQEKEKEKEAFIPGIKGFIRPHIRNARNFSEGFYQKHTSDISNLFRKFGIM
jgi:hypothetical protein